MGGDDQRPATNEERRRERGSGGEREKSWRLEKEISVRDKTVLKTYKKINSSILPNTFLF